MIPGPGILNFDMDKILTMKEKVVHYRNSGSAVYFFGMVGTAVYYISMATGFWMGVVGFLKSLVWPAFLVYELLKHAGA